MDSETKKKNRSYFPVNDSTTINIQNFITKKKINLHESIQCSTLKWLQTLILTIDQPKSKITDGTATLNRKYNSVSRNFKT